MNEKKQNTVIILGMHRSGTSLIGGILQCLDVNLGEEQLGKDWSNPRGHFEDVDFLTLNTKILASAGGSWSDPPRYSDILSLKGDFQHDIRELIQKRNETNSERSWGWKDPRTSLTIDLYLPFIQQPFFVWCQRDPAAISRSLQKRNQIQPTRALELVEYYNEQISNFIQRNLDLNVFVLEYENLIENPQLWINRIIDYLGLDPKPDQVKNAIDFVLDPNGLQRAKWLARIFHLVTAPKRLFKRIFG
jgi:hypothetical protein